MDSDLKLLLSAWLANELDRSALDPVLIRLKSDDEFRTAFVAEIAMLGQLKAVQSSEPRWLELEDLLAASLNDESTDEEFTSRVMRSIEDAPSVGQKSETGESVSSRKSTEEIWKIASRRSVSNVTWVAIAAFAVTMLAIWWNSKQAADPFVPDPFVPDQIAIEDRGDTHANPADGSKNKATVDAVAVLGRAVDAQWDGGSPEIGDALPPGNLVLKSGTVQIEFLTGVRLLIRAPADFELRSADEILLRQGAASCFVTEMGRGFRILTKDMEVVDVGTAFSINVQQGQEPEVHVLEGSVEINSPKRETLELTELHAIRMNEHGPQKVAYTPGRFPQPAELRDLQREWSQDRYESWQSQANQLSKDPSVMLHYTFQETDPSALELTNRAALPNATDGAVIGCRWTEGRWPSKRALLYRNAGDRVLFQVPGAFEAVTFLAWVRIDALTQETTSLMMTESPIRRKQLTKTNEGNFTDAQARFTDAQARREISQVQTVRWELGQATSNSMFAIGYGVKRRVIDWTYDPIAVANPATHSDEWGNWACLAVTCDVSSGDVIHYLNGQRIGVGELTRMEPLLLDFMEIGNFGVTIDELERTAGQSQRRFYGAFDEVIIAKRVFSDTELAEIWEYGKP